ncbi:chromosomal replication initiator DnaA [Thalassococcus sp. BH17M4-6]|uniref:chromosomal replication initiator DnaA n=1 Tax=Thalassococcus sp. BH17M4-6 TaxID=3413148 RepID=UPI003BD036D2
MAQQLRFNLPVRPALGRGDFLVTEANAVATALIDDWQGWPGSKLVLTGPRGSGKTHLAHVWQASADAALLPARDLASADIPALATGCVCVEDTETIAGDPKAEDALFHLHNLTLAQGHSLLVTARQAPSRWGLTLPDLASRLNGTTVARLQPPDDMLLTVVLAKLFADRQIVPAADVLPYLVRHMPRSFAMAGAVVEALDNEALGRPKGVTRKLASEILAGLASAPPDSPE